VSNFVRHEAMVGREPSSKLTVADKSACTGDRYSASTGCAQYAGSPAGSEQGLWAQKWHENKDRDQILRERA
jgi:hypothetical protein